MLPQESKSLVAADVDTTKHVIFPDPSELADKIIDTIWAVTTFIYTGENVVKFHRQDARCTDGTEGCDRHDISRSLREYFVDGNMSARDIAKLGNITTQNGPDASMSQTTKKSHDIIESIKAANLRVLWDVEDGNAPSAASAYGVSPQVSVMSSTRLLSSQKPIVVFGVAVGRKRLQCLVDFRPPDDVQTPIAYVADTVGQVCRSIIAKYDEPVGRMDFLGKLNLDCMAKNIQALAPRVDAALGDIILQQGREHDCHVICVY
jgi:hypothetical protein